MVSTVTSAIVGNPAISLVVVLAIGVAIGYFIGRWSLRRSLKKVSSDDVNVEG